MVKQWQLRVTTWCKYVKVACSARACDCICLWLSCTMRSALTAHHPALRACRRHGEGAARKAAWLLRCNAWLSCEFMIIATRCREDGAFTPRCCLCVLLAVCLWCRLRTQTDHQLRPASCQCHTEHVQRMTPYKRTAFAYSCATSHAWCCTSCAACLLSATLLELRGMQAPLGVSMLAILTATSAFCYFAWAGKQCQCLTAALLIMLFCGACALGTPLPTSHRRGAGSSRR